jgi:hypothetical protein
MKETIWASQIARRLAKHFQKFRVEAGKRLIYANEIREYGETQPAYKDMKYETDILIYQETKSGGWIPRVVIETKINSITTHGAIIYSQKSATHKQVHPYLRYGIFLGNRGDNALPGRLFRHGAHFDFMLSWKRYRPTEPEWKALTSIVRQEITASKNLEKLIFDSRKSDRDKIFYFHKPLKTK